MLTVMSGRTSGAGARSGEIRSVLEHCEFPYEMHALRPECGESARRVHGQPAYGHPTLPYGDPTLR